MPSSAWIILGRVTGLYGIKGWVKVFSHAEPRSGITDYEPLYLNLKGDWQAIAHQGRAHGKGVVMKFAAYDDRDAAASLIGCELAIQRDQLPPPAPGEYYWNDLQGLQVRTLDGVELGRVDHLFATGANDVVVVKDAKRERLIPFLRPDVVVAIDIDQGLLTVDWDPEF